MERHEGDTGARALGDEGAESRHDEDLTGADRRPDDRVEGAGHGTHNDAAGPDQTGDDGFGEGYDQVPDTPEETEEPNFARGISREPVPGTEHHGRFSEGQEQLPDTAEKDVERRFSEGQERSPTSE